VEQIIYDNYSELSLTTAQRIASIMQAKPDALLCFPAGDTSIGTFNHLIELNRAGAISFKECKIVGLDEWTNLGGMKGENCFSFLKKHLFDHIDYSSDNLCFFDGESSDLEMECNKTNAFIRKYGPIDMMLLGVGMNGHLGLNEPGTSFDLYSHIVLLDDITKNIGKKYFSGEVHLSGGISLGVKYIMEARTVILQLNGEKKAEIVKRLIESDLSTDFPASVLKSHANAFLLMDKQASKYL
jgi:glucosamine-6-phosphate isomerase